MKGMNERDGMYSLDRKHYLLQWRIEREIGKRQRHRFGESLGQNLPRWSRRLQSLPEIMSGRAV